LPLGRREPCSDQRQFSTDHNFQIPARFDEGSA
jgi:hypothetical protein